MKTFIALSGLAGLVAALPVNTPSFSLQPGGPLKPTGAVPVGPASGPAPTGSAPFPFPSKHSGGFAAPTGGVEPHHHHHTHDPSFPTGKKPGEGESLSFPAPTAAPSLAVRDAQFGSGGFQSDITTAPDAGGSGGAFPSFSFPAGGFGGGAGSAAPTGGFGGGLPSAGGSGGSGAGLCSFSFPVASETGAAVAAPTEAAEFEKFHHHHHSGSFSGFPAPTGGFPSSFPSGFPFPSGGFPFPTGGFPAPTGSLSAPSDVAKFERVHHHSTGYPGFPSPTGGSSAPSGPVGTGAASAPEPSFSFPAGTFTPVGPVPTHSASYWGA